MTRKFISDEKLARAVSNANSVTDAIRNLGLHPHSGIHGHYSKRIRDAGISTEHFDKSLYRRGLLPKKTPDEILTKKARGSNRTSGATLRRALIEVGVPYECSECGALPQWQGKDLTLHIDHIDGNRNNDSRENLRFLDPNCHSQTETWGQKNSPIESRCSRCNKIIGKYGKTGLCKSCIQTSRWDPNDGLEGYKKAPKIDWPSTEELLSMLEDSNCSAVGRSLGVSDNAIKKHLQRRGAWKS